VIGGTQVILGNVVNSGGNTTPGTLTAVSTATCPAGTKLLGGGATIDNGSASRGVISLSAPTPRAANGNTPTGWQAQGVTVPNSTTGAGGNGSYNVQAYAVCST
jgi:hypothetical protein